mmetsp:Transcript_40064/g.100254  ORF Transcript_40064/g.100254 Transcript_40064/m.100254 type:complete len:515 (-) Transcript_40064:152-1696(-)
MSECRPNLNGTQRVALQVVKQHFGEAAEGMCDALMKRPRRSLKELQQDCPTLPLGQLRNSLLVTIQHNMVSAVVEGAGKGKECRYSFDTCEAVLRLRYPKFSAYVRAIHGADAERVLEAVLDHGRATWDQIKAACAEMSEESIKEAGDMLVDNMYLVRVVTPNPEDEQSSQAYSASKAGSSKFAGIGGKRGATMSPGDKRAAKSRKKEGGSVYAGLSIEEICVPEGGISANGVSWRLGAEAFAWDLRGEAMKQLVSDRAGAESGALTHLLLKAVRSTALVNKMHSVTVEQVLEHSKGSASQQLANSNLELSWESVSERLMALSHDGLVKRVSDRPGGSTTFQPEITILRKSMRQDIIERVVEAKMGLQARRIMGLLLHHPLLESKAVWDLAMLPKKDANEVLCRMLKHGYVGLQEVPRTADHSAQRTFFLWYVDMDKVIRLVKDDMMRTMHEMLLKREEKRQQSEDVVGIGGEVRDLDAAPAQKQQYHALQIAIERLELAVLRLDETLLLLSDS